MNVLVIGQTTMQMGRMEYGNIGNYYIIEPFFRELHQAFPNSKIKTTLQLSERFCKDENVERLPIELYYDFNGPNVEYAKREVSIVQKYLKTGFFDATTPYINEVISADIVIDFSGDIWGANADLLAPDRFKVGILKNKVAQDLGKFTALLSSSPGPFKYDDTLELAKEVFNNFDIVVNREAISRSVLENYGFNTKKVVDGACPAFLFERNENSFQIEYRDLEKLVKNEKKIIGFIICGFNFMNGPHTKWPRSDSEYCQFAEAVEFINNNLNASVCLMSHANGFTLPPAEFKHIHGSDYKFIKQLQHVIETRGIANDVFTLDGIYDPWKTKSIIGNFDMLVSGRIHGAVAGLSQSIPTVIIDYGHEPKAHKLRGFAQLVHSEEFICNPNDSKDIIKKIDLCWNRLSEEKERLQNIIPKVQKLARETFTILKDSYVKISNDIN